MKALSVRMPWALAIFSGKDIENRSRWTNYRGPLAIHASASMTGREYREACVFIRSIGMVPPPYHECIALLGKVIGTVELYECVSRSDSPWFVGDFGWKLRKQARIEPVVAKGQLGFWEWREAA